MNLDFLQRIENDRIKNVKYSENLKDTANVEGIIPIKVNIEFSGKVKNEEYVKRFAEHRLTDAIDRIEYQKNVVHPDINNFKYEIKKRRMCTSLRCSIRRFNFAFGKNRRSPVCNFQEPDQY